MVCHHISALINFKIYNEKIAVTYFLFRGLQIVDPENGYSDKPEVLQQLLELRVKLLCNTAACQNKVSKTLSFATEVL